MAAVAPSAAVSASSACLCSTCRQLARGEQLRLYCGAGCGCDRCRERTTIEIARALGTLPAAARVDVAAGALVDAIAAMEATA